MKPSLTIALPKGRLFRASVDLLTKVACGVEALGEGRRLIFVDPVRHTHFLILRPVDIPTYVEYGAADVGIVGKDVLEEWDRDVYDPLDLNFGRCRLVVAQPHNLPKDIVDLVDTGRTLVENGLEEVDEIMQVTARLIVNRASHKTKYEQVTDLVARLKQAI